MYNPGLFAHSKLNPSPMNAFLLKKEARKRKTLFDCFLSKRTIALTWVKYSSPLAVEASLILTVPDCPLRPGAMTNFSLSWTFPTIYLPKAYEGSPTEYIVVVVPSILAEVPPGHDLVSRCAGLKNAWNHDVKKRVVEYCGPVVVCSVP